MNGSHVAEYYTAYLEDTLPEALRREVDAHLRDCPQCAAELAEMRALVATLREMPVVAVPEGFTQRVSARVPRRAPRAIWWRGPVFAGGVLASALAIMLVIMHFNTAPVTQVADSRMEKQSVPPPQVETGVRSPAVGENVAAEADKALPSPIAAKAEIKPAAPRPLKGVVRDPFVSGKVGADNVPTPSKVDMASAQKTDEKERVEIAAVPPSSAFERTEKGLFAYDDAGNATNGKQPTTGNGADVFGRSVKPTGSVRDETAYRLHDENDTDGSAVSATSSTAGVSKPEEKLDTALSLDTASRNEATSEVTVSSPTSITSAATSNMSKSRGDAFSAVNTNLGYTYYSGCLTGSMSALPLPFGNVQVVAKNLPDGKGDTVALRVDGAAAVTGTVQTSGAMANAVTLTPQAREMAVSLPKSKSAAVFNITLQSEGKAERCAFIAPAPVTRKAKVSLRVTNQPALRTLTTLANQAGVFVLCPQAFAEQKISLDVKDVSPRDAFKTVAEQHRHRAELAGNVVYIAPVK